MSDAVTVKRDGDEWSCELRDGRHRVVVRLANLTRAGLSVAGVAVTSEGPSAVTASYLRRAPYARWIQEAKDAVARETSGRPLRRVAEVVLSPFLEDRRGSAGRSDRDYAQLAEFYISGGQPNRHLARDLAARHGGSVQTWRNHLVKAKRYICVGERFTEDGALEQVHLLTEEAVRLIYGDNSASGFENEDLREREYVGATNFIRRHEARGILSTERSYALFEMQRYGEQEVARRLAAARRVVDNYGKSRG